MFTVSGFIVLIIVLVVLFCLLGFSWLVAWLGNDDHYNGLH